MITCVTQIKYPSGKVRRAKNALLNKKEFECIRRGLEILKIILINQQTYDEAAFVRGIIKSFNEMLRSKP